MPGVFSTSMIGTLWVNNCSGGSFLGIFLDQGGFSFGHPFGYVCFLQASVHFDSNSVMDGSELFKSESMSAIKAGNFLVWYFLLSLWLNQCVYWPLSFLQHFATFFFYFVYLFSFFCYDPSVPVFYLCLESNFPYRLGLSVLVLQVKRYFFTD